MFQVTTNGVLTTLVSFNRAIGDQPWAGLTLGSDGNLYGTTWADGPGGGGTIFRLVTSPKFTRVAPQSGGDLLLSATGLPNNAYRLWVATDLSLPLASWTLLTSGSFDTEGNYTYTDSGAGTNSSRFYRITVP